MSGDIKASLHIIIEELAKSCGDLDDARAERLIEAIDSAPTVFVAGAGRSGLLMRCFAMRLMHMGRKVFVIGEIVTPAIAPGDLLLIGSGSGETGSLALMAAKAKKIGANVALITINPDSGIGRIADAVLAVKAPSPKLGFDNGAHSVQPMGNLFEQSMFLILDAIVMRLMAKNAATSDVMFTRHANLE